MAKIRSKSSEEQNEQPLLGREAPEDDDGEFEVPKRSVPTAWAAKVIYDSLRATHAKRARGFARIQGMLDGNPPYPKEALKRAGQMANSNVNFRDAESWFESIALVYWSLFNDVQYLAEFETTIGDPAINTEYASIVAEHWDQLMREWDEFYPVMEENQADFITFGLGPLFWPDERDWRFEAIDVFRFLVPEKTRNSSKRLGMAAIEHVYSIQEFIDIIENADDDSGWDKEILKELVVRKFYTDSTEKQQYSGQMYAQIQTKIRNGDLQADERYNDDILVVSLFAREFDGKISRGIFDPMFFYDQSTQLGKLKHEETDGWLFYSDRPYDNFAQALHFYTFTQGQKFIHGQKGLGHKIFNIIEGSTQIENSLMDSVRRSSTVLVKSRNTRNKGVSQIHFTHGGIVDIGEADFVQNLMGSNFQSNVAAIQYFDQKIQRNNNISGTSMSSPDGKPKTAGEARIQATREAKVQKNRIAHYYKETDNLFSEVLRKQLNSKPGYPGYEEVQEFKERCIARGVPKEFFTVTSENTGTNGLPKHLKIRATRSSGSGSQVADQIEIDAMMTLLPTLGQRGRVNVIKDRIAAYRGFRFIPRYYPPEDQSNEPVGDDTIASIENNQLEKGEMVIVSPDNKHAVHAPRHLERLKQIAQEYDKAEGAARQAGSETPSIDAINYGHYGLNETDIAFQTIGPHFVRHLLYLGNDSVNKSLVDSLHAQWAILANFGDKIANNAQEVRDKKIRDLKKGNEQMDKLSSEERVGMAQVASDARIKLAKLQIESQQAATRDQLQYLVQRLRVSFDNQLKAQKAEHDAALEAKQVVSEQQNNTGKADGALY